MDDVAEAYRSAAYAAAVDSGLELEHASGSRSLFHGWYGAQFDSRNGIFGVFGKLTADEEKKLEAAAAAGYEAAVKFAAAMAAE